MHWAVAAAAAFVPDVQGMLGITLVNLIPAIAPSKTALPPAGIDTTRSVFWVRKSRVFHGPTCQSGPIHFSLQCSPHSATFTATMPGAAAAQKLQLPRRIERACIGAPAHGSHVVILFVVPAVHRRSCT